MTNEEAITYLKLDKDGHEAAEVSDDTKHYWNCVIEALDMAVIAMQKDIPMRPIKKIWDEKIEGGEKHHVDCYCPTCSQYILHYGRDRYTRCIECGQVLDWRDD